MVISGPTENGFYRFGRRLAGFPTHYHQTNIYEIETAARRVMECLEIRSLPPVAVLFRISLWRSRTQT
jgi:hypothetical protein